MTTGSSILIHEFMCVQNTYLLPLTRPGLRFDVHQIEMREAHHDLPGPMRYKHIHKEKAHYWKNVSPLPDCRRYESPDDEKDNGAALGFVKDGSDA
ncbi:hypothetical protein NUU61_006438 [Penicillium alfredii]|uniref:Uncharacterized protein n=1 Tax=Penicillium alfredii TaxID=1506179 RepID=A0A9W9F0T9_9EURO|nr:uncharacterized protein NUU61_006438 [Penicillium alfredii]KAJ5091568.1 hypothetical protein NUU61_006438 [Penicillium alfredii]